MYMLRGTQEGFSDYRDILCTKCQNVEPHCVMCQLAYLQPIVDALLVKLMDTWQSGHFLCLIKITHTHYTPEQGVEKEDRWEMRERM